MNRMKKVYQKHTNIILNTMCLYVGCNYNDIDMQEDNWYFKYTWDEQTENEFRDWLISYIYGIKDAQRELYGFSYMKKTDCEKAADTFLLSYGWCNKQPQWYLDELKTK